MQDKRVVLNIITVVLFLFVLLETARLFVPFFQSAAWATIIVLFLHPVYLRLNAALKDKRGLSSAVMCIFVVAFVIMPAVFLSFSLVDEASSAFASLKGILGKDFFDSGRLPPGLAKYGDIIGGYLAAVHLEIKEIWPVLGKMGGFFVARGTSVFVGVLDLIAGLVFTIFFCYYFFRDGEGFIAVIKSLIPMPEDDKNMFMGMIHQVLCATLRGSLLTGLVQGCLGLFIFLVTGFSAPILLGVLTGFASFIPVVGTSMVWVPATLYLLISGSTTNGLILLGFSVLVISQADHFLRPMLIGGRMELHRMLLFFSILGGLALFGILGIFLGPMLTSMSVAILEIYRKRFLVPEGIEGEEK